MLGTAYATNIAGYHILGMEGWRFAFRTVALVAMLIGFLTLRFATDPNFAPRPDGQMREPEKKAGMRETVSDFLKVRLCICGSGAPPVRG